LNRPSTITNPRVRILPSSGIILSILSTPPSAAIPELSQVRPDLVRRTILVFVLPSLFPIPVAPAAVPPLEPGTTVLGTDTYKALPDRSTLVATSFTPFSLPVSPSRPQLQSPIPITLPSSPQPPLLVLKSSHDTYLASWSLLLFFLLPDRDSLFLDCWVFLGTIIDWHC
jgi:hypothetical protein